ncbi:hypothetical protein SAMN04488523_108171 [Sulfitobacter brevis]|uniref:Flp pilus assembly protein, pilin Flp n=1 Tax=Sulfitobacter brevis TaxID=74348 RepID=A0A1I2BPH6_9RHOB|nr:hypothetical protein SAMN04488523_108171 [Sulfitobacter brevis]
MMMISLLAFVGDEEGAVTVDWVVLTAAIVSLAAIATVSLKENSDSLAVKTQTYISDRAVGE